MRAVGMVFAVAALTAMAVGGWSAEEKAAPEYVGVKKCRFCHKPQFDSWSKTKHAEAFSILSDEAKKKPECVQCHVTGKMADGTVIENVECEACHGPGSEYSSIKIMNRKKWAADPETYRKRAVEAGLVYPGEQDCQRCHKKEGNPNFKPFDFAKKNKIAKSAAARKIIDEGLKIIKFREALEHVRLKRWTVFLRCGSLTGARGKPFWSWMVAWRPAF